MPFWRLYYHLNWATKKRAPYIQPEVELELYAAIAREAAELGVRVYAINGWYDHVHVLVAIPPQNAVAHVVKCLKGASSHHVNHNLHLDYHFEWQRGYGALSIGEKERPRVEAYVARQKAHHGQQTTDDGLERATELEPEVGNTPLPLV
jgi:REP element-mobilizing transposase RayT